MSFHNRNRIVYSLNHWVMRNFILLHWEIIRNLHTIGLKCKNQCDIRPRKSLNTEPDECCQFMAGKKHVNQVGATTVTCLRPTKPWKGTGWMIIRDSWFVSVKSIKELFQTNRLFSILLLRIAYKVYTKHC